MFDVDKHRQNWTEYTNEKMFKKTVLNSQQLKQALNSLAHIVMIPILHSE